MSEVMASQLENEMLSVCEVRMVAERNMTVCDLFSGYDVLKAITFSYSVNFIDHILDWFDSAQVILGGEFLVRKSKDLHDAIYEAFAYAHESVSEVTKYPQCVEMMRSGSLEFKASNIALDHRKLFILSNSVTGATRVIMASANATGKAWLGENIECMWYDDTKLSYETHMKKFETAWSLCADIPYNVGVVDENDIVAGNVLVKGQIAVNNMCVVPAYPISIEKDIVQYAISHEKLKDFCRDGYSKVLKQSKSGRYILKPKDVERAANEAKSVLRKRQIDIKSVIKDFPCMTYELGDTPSMSVDDVVQDLSPSDADIRNDLDVLCEIFDNFETKFVRNLDVLKENHWKLLVYLFVSPYVANFRCACTAMDISEMSLPLFVFLLSRTADSGKTFMVRAILRMMTGQSIRVNMASGAGLKDNMEKVQCLYSGFPFLFDEISGRSFSHSVADVVKDAPTCENNCRDKQPVLVFTSNHMTDPDDTYRKRALTLVYDSMLEDDLDRNMFKNYSNRLLSRCGNALYREYTRRILRELTVMMDKVWDSADDKSGWYPDLTNASSRVLLDIFEEYGYMSQLPDCVRVLTFNADYYSCGVNAGTAVREIQELYDMDSSVFTIGRDFIKIKIGNDSEQQKMRLRSWENTLPPSANAKVSSGRDGVQLTVARASLEKLGFKCHRRFGLFGR